MGRPLRCGKAAVVGAAVIMAGAAQADTADLARATCADYTTLRAPDRDQLAIWLHGYFAGAAQRSALDTARVAEAAAALQKACEATASMPLIGPEARAIFLGDPPPPPATKPPPPKPPTPTR